METNIGLLVSKRAELNPDKEAYVDADSGLRLTFSQLNRRVNRLANAALTLGVEKGDRVAILQMNGIEFVRKVQSVENLKKIPIVMVTTEAERERIVEAIKAGAKGYVVKPFTPETLQEKIQELIT